MAAKLLWQELYVSLSPPLPPLSLSLPTSLQRASSYLIGQKKRIQLPGGGN